MINIASYFPQQKKQNILAKAIKLSSAYKFQNCQSRKKYHVWSSSKGFNYEICHANINERSLAAIKIDPLGQPKVTPGRYHCFRTCCSSECLSVRSGNHFSNLEKQNNRKQWSLLACLWVWPSWSLMTPVLFKIDLKCHEEIKNYNEWEMIFNE